MTIEQLKQDISAKTGVQFPVLNLQQQSNEAGELQPWYSHWDNENRISITMHKEVFEKIMENKERNDLAAKRETVLANSEREGFQRFVVIIPKNMIGTL